MVCRPIPNTYRSRSLVSVKVGEFHLFQVFPTCNREIRKNKIAARQRRRTMDGIHNLQTPVLILVPQTLKYELEIC
jgi:hypothetical protein